MWLAYNSNNTSTASAARIIITAFDVSLDIAIAAHCETVPAVRRQPLFASWRILRRRTRRPPHAVNFPSVPRIQKHGMKFEGATVGLRVSDRFRVSRKRIRKVQSDSDVCAGSGNLFELP